MNRHFRRRELALTRKIENAVSPSIRSHKPSSPLPAWRAALLGGVALGVAMGGTTLAPDGAWAGTFTPGVTAGEDTTTLTGTSDGDFDDALGGNDSITVDTKIGINAGATVTGGAGDDTIDLAPGVADLGVNAGGAGQVLGDAGADTITLNSNHVGYRGAGTVSGGADNDSIALTNRSNIGLYGGSTGQVLGDDGDDTITLDDSNVGNSGAGTVSGGADNDSIALTNGSIIGRSSTGTGQVLGDAGADTITLDDSTVGNSGAGTVSGGDDNDSITLTNDSHVGRNAGSTGQVLGDAGADTIALDSSIVGYYGDGTVSGGDDNDSITLTNDSHVGRNAGSTGQVLGDAGADTIALDSSIVGYYGDGTVSGGAGNDSITLTNQSYLGTLTGSTGQVLGDAGADTITIDRGRVGASGTGRVSGGDDNDIITLTNGSILGRDAGGTGQVLGDAGDDTITISDSTIGGAGSATVSGGDDNDSIALTGTTSLNATAQVLGDAGNDTVSIDSTVTRTAGSLIDGGTGTDQLVFNTLADTSLAPGGFAGFANFEQFAKTGAATLTLTGAQNIFAQTDVNAGTLIVSDSLTSAAININAGGSLQTDTGNLIGTVTNSGMFNTGGTGTIENTDVTGNFVQTSTGMIKADVDAVGGTADTITVSGTADLAGTVDVNLISGNPISQTTILTAAGGVTDNGIAVGTVTGANNPLTSVGLSFIGANTLTVNITLNTVQGNFNPNQSNFVNNINAGASPTVLGALVSLSNNAETGQALDQLTPEFVLNSEEATQASTAGFLNDLFSCQVTGPGMTAISEGSCLWARTEGRVFDANTTSQTIGSQGHAIGLSVGGQKAVDEDWRLGFSLGFERAELETSSGAESDSDRYHAGAIVKYQSGPMLFAAAFSGGIANVETSRQISFGGLTATHTADYDVLFLGTQLRAAYLAQHNGYYIKPLIDLNLTWLDRDGFTETGNTATALVVQGSSDTYLSVSPAIELGTDHAVSDSETVRPYVKVGATVYADNEHSLTVGFAGAPGGTPGFQITTESDDVFFDFEAGLTLISTETGSLQFGYQGRASENTTQHGAFLKAAIKF